MGQRYEYGIDFDRVEAIDVHTHVEVDGHGHKAYDDVLVTATGRYFKMEPGVLASVDAVADHYRQRNTAAVVFTIDARHGMRHTPNSIGFADLDRGPQVERQHRPVGVVAAVLPLLYQAECAARSGRHAMSSSSGRGLLM